jgi:PAS domain S-box-containing protein
MGQHSVSRDGELNSALIASPSPIMQTASSEWDFEDFFENGAVALHLVGGDGTILHANRAELELLGFSAEEYIGRHIANFHVDQEVIEDILARLKRGEKLQKYAARLRARDGTIKHVEITSSAQFKNGRFVNTRCFTMDVTQLHEAREEVRRKDEHFRQLLEALPAAVYTTDSNGKITYFNRFAAELAGRDPEIGKDEWCVTFRLFSPDGRPLPHDQCPMAIALRENRPVRGVEALAQRPDGTLFPFLPFPTPIRDERGALVGAVNMLVDITERKQAEAHQRVLLDELNHRVKNNMQMLYGLLSAAKRETKNAEASEVLADASQRVAAMAAAQQLLYSDKNPHGFSINDFLHGVCASAKQGFGKEVAVRIEAESGHLSNELSMPLALILNELLTNAAKHGINGRGEGQITVKLKRSDGQVTLSVEDDGPGFDLRETGRRSSGLGLVTGLCRQMRGTFEVDRGVGARCIVRFSDLGRGYL